MSECVYGAAGEDLCRRMRNWARWSRAESDGSPLPSCLGSFAIEIGTRVDRYREPTDPLLNGEGVDTERALRELPPRFSQIIRQFWLNEGKGLRWNARHRRIDKNTVFTWLIQGHYMLLGVLTRRAQSAHRRRAEFKALGAGT